MNGAFLVGRLILASYFLYNGVNHFLNVGFMAQYAAAKGVPTPAVAVLCAGVLLLIGGITFLFGIYPRVGVAAITLFFVAVTPIMHNFWAVDPQQAMGDMINFTKNFALLGATLMLLAIPEPWPFSVASPRRAA